MSSTVCSLLYVPALTENVGAGTVLSMTYAAEVTAL